MTLFDQYKQVLKLQYLRIRGTIVVFAIMQIIISLGIAIGFTYLYADVDSQSILYLATGAPTIVIIMTGLVILPNQISSARIEGHGEFLRTLPVKRLSIILADTTIWILVTIPGIVISLLVTYLMYKPNFDISILVLPVYLLSALTCIGVGYAFSYAMPPMFALALSQVIAFMALMFSPINFPMERLPFWLQVVHNILPISSIAKIMRFSLASTTFTANSVDILKVLLWCVGGYIISVKILNRK